MKSFMNKSRIETNKNEIFRDLTNLDEPVIPNQEGFKLAVRFLYSGEVDDISNYFAFEAYERSWESFNDFGYNDFGAVYKPLPMKECDEDFHEGNEQLKNILDIYTGFMCLEDPHYVINSNYVSQFYKTLEIDLKKCTGKST